ncbi:MAG: hypothetical protein CMC76_01095 [Flavobacteriaceae bacterium]|uniref:hypothetical protein n=1 Tax=Winogradskyella sp. SYSU M77433 TaxID=3042722 RepID=UPI000C46BB77|nr:hypothetical protein [Winogradskyella sp. SYSU M77433]MAX69690.1 hypothetical protein [Flavobacteriaceae bacterium]MDH7913615.1 hypothetical protein [Winogradskyella sp. SYSU M77433]|tara:strand:+ start:5845 stop:7032 length:1188 start_codon:yes stop_codon:yes gene_type:complete
MSLNIDQKQVYNENVNKIRDDVYKTKFDEIESMGLLGTYLMVSANLSTFISDVKSDNHYKVIQDIQFHRSLSSLDQYYFHLLDDLETKDEFNTLEKCHDEGHIFVTYHTGSYRLFIQKLNKENIPFCLVTEGDYIKDQGDVTQTLFKKLNNNKRDLEILPAENPRLIFELIKRLKQGISVVFYIDGNKGASNKSLEENKNLLKINFLNNHIYARQGIAFLSYLSKAPLVTALTKRDKDLNNSICLKPVDTLKLINDNDRNGFINIITKKLYGELESFLKESPEQWEGWFYIDKFFQYEDSQNEKLKTKVNFTSDQKITLKINQFVHLIKHSDENMFLVSKKDYKIMKITDFLYETLSYFKTPRVVSLNKILSIRDTSINWSMLEELIEMKFLKSV